MQSYTIYSNGVWERMLEKYPKLKELATKCGCENNPQKAQGIRKKRKHDFCTEILSDIEYELATELFVIEFIEKDFLEGFVERGEFAIKAGAIEDAIISFECILDNFDDAFNDWYLELGKRKSWPYVSFNELYEIFLDVIKLKLDYKILYTKLFICRLLYNSTKSDDLFEIKQYFLKRNQEMLSKI